MFPRFRDFFLASVVTAVYWLYSRFWIIEHLRRPSVSGPRVYAHWHGDELLLVAAFAGSGMAVMSSKSRDGQLMGRVLTWLGYRVVQGSSSRGGAAGLKGLMDAVTKEGLEASLAVDGPRGPVYQVKPGILKLAQQTQLPLVPGAAAASRRFVFKKAWNQCYLPLPFAKCVIVYGEPIQVPALLTDEEFEALRQRVEHRLFALKEEAEGYFSRPVKSPTRLTAAAENPGV